MQLLKANITAAAAASLSQSIATVLVAPRNACLQANFIYGSGGTKVTAWVQTSLDGGMTWTDIACFTFTTASARKLFNLNGQTPVTTEYTPTDGTLADDTCKDGILGTQLRVKYTSTGTYAGSSQLIVSMASDQVG